MASNPEAHPCHEVTKSAKLMSTEMVVEVYADACIVGAHALEFEKSA